MGKRVTAAGENIRNQCLRYGTAVEWIKPRRTCVSSTGVVGVSYYPKINRYIARLTLRKQRYYLGCFETLREAADARRKAERTMFDPIIEQINADRKENAVS